MPTTSFHIAMEGVKSIESRLSDEEKLKLYSLYRQAYVGDCNSVREGIVGAKALAKWYAWNARKGQTKENASEEYVTYVNELKSKYDD